MSLTWLVVEGTALVFMTEGLIIILQSLLGCEATESQGNPAPSVATQDHVAAVVGNEGRNEESKG